MILGGMKYTYKTKYQQEKRNAERNTEKEVKVIRQGENTEKIKVPK